MRRILTLCAGLLAFAVLMSGCASQETKYANEIKKALKKLEELRKTYTKVKDEQMVAGAQSGIVDLSNELEDIRNNIEELTPSSEKTKEHILRKYSEPLGNILGHLKVEENRVLKMKGGAAIREAGVANVRESYEELVIKDEK